MLGADFVRGRVCQGPRCPGINVRLAEHFISFSQREHKPSCKIFYVFLSLKIAFISTNPVAMQLSVVYNLFGETHGVYGYLVYKEFKLFYSTKIQNLKYRQL